MSLVKRQWSIPPNRRSLLIIFLVLTNVTLAALFARSWWNNWQAEFQTTAFATWAGDMQAHADYANGVRRQYELVADASAGFTGRHDGPFEVWRWPDYPSFGHSHMFGDKVFVKTYNSRMQFLQQHPDQFRPGEMGAHNSKNSATR